MAAKMHAVSTNCSPPAAFGLATGSYKADGTKTNYKAPNRKVRGDADEESVSKNNQTTLNDRYNTPRQLAEIHIA